MVLELISSAGDYVTNIWNLIPYITGIVPISLILLILKKAFDIFTSTWIEEVLSPRKKKIIDSIFEKIYLACFFVTIFIGGGWLATWRLSGNSLAIVQLIFLSLVILFIVAIGLLLLLELLDEPIVYIFSKLKWHNPVNTIKRIGITCMIIAYISFIVALYLGLNCYASINHLEKYNFYGLIQTDLPYMIFYITIFTALFFIFLENARNHFITKQVTYSVTYFKSIEVVDKLNSLKLLYTLNKEYQILSEDVNNKWELYAFNYKNKELVKYSLDLDK